MAKSPISSAAGAFALSVVATATAGKAQACDQLVGRLVTHFAQPAIQRIDCGTLGRAGIDKADHQLTSVCYSSVGPTSKIELKATFRCKSGDHAVFNLSLSGDVTANVEVRGSDCLVTLVDFQTSGELASAAAGIFDVKGRIRRAVETALSTACR